jgi:quercetin dioxygenase-like cupin family protein
MNSETVWHKNSITLVPMAKAEGKRPFFPWFQHSFLTLKNSIFYIMMVYDIDPLTLEKKNLYNPPPGPERKQEKYHGKFTNDEFDIHEIIDANISQEQELYYVTFKKGCRTRPHIHATDQTLVAIKGKGIVIIVDKIEINSDGKSATIKSLSDKSSSSSTSSSISSSSSVIELSEGDVICVPAGKLHWHGALVNSSDESDSFSHLAIRKRTDIETIWF